MKLILIPVVACIFQIAFSISLPHTFGSELTSINQQSNTNIHLIKRRSKPKKSSHKNKTDCSKRACSLKLKPCPKKCPQSCGYINSPDSCCPLLGTPVCPKY
ncbi:uncharacterized protein B0P05DRAFT_561991 [Gilbertella persicaria]|uniref:uncharacterized protein n=1 Tax=Gilbertella persicaria TaxID=101096 RepID=UPI002220BEF1|nr:uncharacterized protein B0P05DRAFT_561991 [Gilbertella persicaria]KAI8052572.1 hypothetical protein B0P05DRAFT_561991 [Gilbertella persicaria]